MKMNKLFAVIAATTFAGSAFADGQTSVDQDSKETWDLPICAEVQAWFQCEMQNASVDFGMLNTDKGCTVANAADCTNWNETNGAGQIVNQDVIDGNGALERRIDINGTPGMQFLVHADAGENSTGATRRMKHDTAASFIEYEVYKPNSLTAGGSSAAAVWGGDDYATGSAWAVTPDANVSSFEFHYFQVAVTADHEEILGATPGLYSDTVTFCTEY